MAMTLEELKEKYSKVPEELKVLKRWVCWNLEDRDGRMTKVPINSLSGNYAKSNDSITWTKFETALRGCAKYQCNGVGFMLGDGVFGVDLDNHEGREIQSEFDDLASEFISSLNSYTEYSQSGKGIHIICFGKLPDGRRRKNNVEMYDSFRFFAFTGNSILNVPIENREKEIIPLWKKYVDDSEEIKAKQEVVAAHLINNPNNKYNFLNYNSDFKMEKKLSDQEVIEKAGSSKNGVEFLSLYRGDLSSHGNDHSAADMAFCSMLAFWCNKDIQQMERIFRSSGLMRPKWDEMRGSDTYGNITLNNALRNTMNGYVNLVDNPVKPQIYTNFEENSTIVRDNNTSHINPIMNIDENGEPIYRIKQNYNKYSYDDTGNAFRFYDYFGDLFKYNKTDKIFMFWTGKTWVKDVKEIHRKYATKLIDILKNEITQLELEKNSLIQEGEVDKADSLKELIDVARKNAKRLANKAGKDAMISEFQSIKDVAVISDEFDKDNYILNTDSGVVDLRTGKISEYNPKLMLSKNTNVEVSFEEPTTWIKFLHSIFDRGNEKEENEIIECIQQCVGYSLSGSTEQQCFFICYGNGSNGKSTFSNQVSTILGDYATTTPVSTLLQQKNGSNSSLLFSLAKLKGARYVETGETDEGDSFAEGTIKSLTGDAKINAAYKFGNEFEFSPTFKIWMSTNNKPFIKGSDYGIWRRIFLFPFLRTFTDKEKDITLPRRLKEESSKILGWAIQGAIKLFKNGKLFIPECIEQEKKDYKNQMDGIARFISRACDYMPGSKVSCRTLYQNYSLWTKETGTYKLSERKFEEKLKEKGIEQVDCDGTLSYIGIKLSSDKTKEYNFRSYSEEMI